MEKEKGKDYSIEKDNQKRLKGISKCIYIIANICKVFAIIGLVGLGIAMIIIPILTSNVKTAKVGNETVLKVFDSDIYYRRTEHSFEFFEKGKENSAMKVEQNDVEAFNKVFDYLEKNNLSKATLIVEVELLLVAVTLFIEILLLKKVHLFFKNIYHESSPFIRENTDLLRSAAKLLIYSFIISVVIGIVDGVLLNVSFSIKLVDILKILVVFFLVYIFEYGCNIQDDTKGKIYSKGE